MKCFGSAAFKRIFASVLICALASGAAFAASLKDSLRSFLKSGSRIEITLTGSGDSAVASIFTVIPREQVTSATIVKAVDEEEDSLSLIIFFKDVGIFGMLSDAPFCAVPIDSARISSDAEFNLFISVDVEAWAECMENLSRM
ncbi:MAG TPA: hypothetical protein DCM57_00425 [Treponema sp.]|nr:hypothetical protein [Treponema sp.]